MIKIRAEQNAVMLFNSDTADTGILSGAELTVLEKWAKSGEKSEFVERLKRLSLISEEKREEFLCALEKCREISAPAGSFAVPESLHIELTSDCPLNCPQCYKDRTQSVNLDVSQLKKIICEAAEIGVFQIALGGGEPLVYPCLKEVVKLVDKLGMACSVTTSGYGVNDDILKELKLAGLKHMQISLNGSTEGINSFSRDGYNYAVNALEMLLKNEYSFGINWVARKDNLDDFPNLLRLAVKMRAGNINVLRYKPSQTEEYKSFALDSNETLRLAEYIRHARGIAIKLDSAFSNMLCHLNGKAGELSGCGAGRRFICLDAKGFFRPCSHVHLSDMEAARTFESLKDYWLNSPDLFQFRRTEDNIGGYCRECEYLMGCRSCRAICGDFYGDTECFVKDMNYEIV